MSKRPGFVLHLTLDVESKEKALQVSRHFLRLMHGVFPEFDIAFSNISDEGEEFLRTYLFCARRSANQMRCMLRPGHLGKHSSSWES